MIRKTMGSRHRSNVNFGDATPFVPGQASLGVGTGMLNYGQSLKSPAFRKFGAPVHVFYVSGVTEYPVPFLGGTLANDVEALQMG
jgi:hypothetical protein